MKHFVLVVLLIFSMQFSAQSPFAVKPKSAPVPPEKIFSKPDETPLFPGGPEAMQKYLEDHISHPP